MAYITFSYDDGLKNNYHLALPLHEKYNIPASLAIIAHRAVSPEFWDKYMSPREIVDADARGHEIVSHGVYHKTKYTELTHDELEYELSHSKKILNGFVSKEIEAINIPFAKYNDEVLGLARKYYKQVRLADERLNLIGEAGGLIYANALNSKSSIERVKKLVDKAILENKWLVLMFHGINDNDDSGGLYSNSKEFLDQSLSYVKEHVREGSLTPVLFRDMLEHGSIESKKKENEPDGVILAEDEGYLITYHPASSESKKMLITFGGLPSSKTRTGFGSDYAIKKGYHHIFVAQAAGSQYQGLSLEEFRDAVLPLCAGKDVYTYGSSLGGYCALYYAGIINAQAIAAAPKNSAHPILKHNLKHPMEFKHLELVDAPKSTKNPIIIYDPHQREDARYIERLVLPAYNDASLVKIPFSGHLVLQVLSEHKILKSFIEGVMERNEIIDVNYDCNGCSVWNYEKGRVLARDGEPELAVSFLKNSLKIRYSKEADKLLKKIRQDISSNSVG